MNTFTVLVEKNVDWQMLNTLNTIAFMMNWTLKTVTLDYTGDRVAITIAYTDNRSVSVSVSVDTN